MVVVHQSRPVGFFSSFNIVVGALSYLKKNQINNFYVSWTNGLYQKQNINLFDSYFYQQTEFTPSKITATYDAVQLGNIYEPVLNRELFQDLHKVLQYYNYFDNKIYKDCLSSCARKSNTLGVHVRRTDHVMHSELLNLEDYFHTIDEKLQQEGYNNIFLSTDDSKIISQFTLRYGSLIFTNDDITRSNNGTAIHFNGFSHKEKLALDVMKDALSLASCDEIIITSSNIAGYVLMTNPVIKYKQIDTHKNHH